MNQARWLAVTVLTAVALAGGWLAWTPEAPPALPCAARDITLDDAGVAHCGAGEPLPAPQALVVGQRLDLNHATADDLAAVPGLGAGVAAALIEARNRQGPFTSWEQVDAVPGVGPGRLTLLRKVVEFQGSDGGAW